MNNNLKKYLFNQDKKLKKSSLFIFAIVNIMSVSNVALAHPQECKSVENAPATFIESTGVVCLETMKAIDGSSTQIYKAALQSLAPEKPNSFELVSVESDTRSTKETSPIYSLNTKELLLPTIDIPKIYGTERYTADLIYKPDINIFELTVAAVYLNPEYKLNETWKPYGMLNSNERRSVDLLGESIPYAKLANAVYSFDNTTIDSWELIEQQDDDSGMQAGLYYNPNTNGLVLAFRGTKFCDFPCSLSETKESFLDLAADALLAVGEVDKQFDDAYNYAENVLNRSEGRKIIVTGHSLGGALAQAIGSSLGLKTFAFNSAATPENFFDTYPSHLTSEELYNSIFVLADIHDPVSNVAESGKAYEGSSHVTPLITFDFKELEINLGTSAELDGIRFDKHSMELLIDNSMTLLTIYSEGW
jgi:hypothetical protein